MKPAKIPVKFADGSINHVSLQFTDSYRDEYTSEILPHWHTCEAITDEVRYLMEHVLTVVPYHEAHEDPDSKVIGGRWVNSNKQDLNNPKCRGRFVAQEVGNGADDAFYAATPPLEAKRLLLSQWAHQRTRGGKALKLHFLDVREAYFHGQPRRRLHTRLPAELGVGRSFVSKMDKTMYGTRDAGAIWE